MPLTLLSTLSIFRVHSFGDRKSLSSAGIYASHLINHCKRLCPLEQTKVTVCLQIRFAVLTFRKLLDETLHLTQMI